MPSARLKRTDFPPKKIVRWPAWQKHIVTASLDGPLVAGSCFTWTTAGLDMPIVSTVYAIEPQRAVLWGGPSTGMVGVHNWLFEATATGTRVITEESWGGTPVEAQPAEARRCRSTLRGPRHTCRSAEVVAGKIRAPRSK